MHSVLTISAGGNSIPAVGQTKILGVILNTSLSLTSHIQSFSKSFWFSLQNLEFWIELFLVTQFKIALTKSGYHIYNHNWQTISIYPLPNLPYLVLFLFLLRDTYYTIYLFIIFIIYCLFPLLECKFMRSHCRVS